MSPTTNARLPTSTIRQILTLAGGILVGSGIGDADLVNEGIGAATALFSFGWMLKARLRF
jgi:hypothetical protein